MTLRLVDPGADEAAEVGLQLLDRRAVTEAAMREYLAQRGFGTAAIEDAVAAFTARGWMTEITPVKCCVNTLSKPDSPGPDCVPRWRKRAWINP